MTTYPKHKVDLIGPGRCVQCFEPVERAMVGDQLKLVNWNGKQWVEHECPKRMAA